MEISAEASRELGRGYAHFREFTFSWLLTTGSAKHHHESEVRFLRARY
jgi:hypothetical protein